MWGGVVDRCDERRKRNWHKPDKPWALHGHRGWGRARRVGPAHLWLPTETARKAPEPRDGNITKTPIIRLLLEVGFHCSTDSFLWSFCWFLESSWNVEERLGRRGVAVQRPAVWSVHVRHTAKRCSVLNWRIFCWCCERGAGHLSASYTLKCKSTDNSGLYCMMDNMTAL